MRLALLSSLVAAGCATVGNYQLANTLGKGHGQFAIEPSYYDRSLGIGEEVILPAEEGDKAVAVSGEDLNRELYLDAGVPYLTAAFRYGVTDQVDVGLRWGANALDAMAKVQLTPPEKKDLVVSVAPSLGGLVVPTGEGGSARLFVAQSSLLVGMGVGKAYQHQIVFGPKVQGWWASGGAEDLAISASYLSVGGHLGVGVRLTPNIHLMPEAAFSMPLSWTVRAVADGDAYRLQEQVSGRAHVVQLGLAVLLGGAGRDPKP